MTEELKRKPILNQRVQKMALTSEKDAIAVELLGGEVKKYSQVICTTPLGCLAAIDTDGLDLLYSQKIAIRCLQYDSATKVGIKFAKRWWEDPAVMGNGKTIQGGQSTTDLPIRTCVYPSNGLNCANPPGVLIASYTWAQDARRMGSLTQENGTQGDKILLDLTLDNLAKMHGISVAQMGEVVDFFAHSWFNDENALGAYALFGPGQFGDPNSDVLSPFVAIKAPAANGRFHFAGEATSAHHGWVLGALNSGWRAVYNALVGHKNQQELLIERWGIPDEENVRNLNELCGLAHNRML
jgi:monoamine oxidase